MFGHSREELVGQPVERPMPDRVRGRRLEQRGFYIVDPDVRTTGVGLDLVLDPVRAPPREAGDCAREH